MKRSTTEPPQGRVVHATAHTMASLKALADFTKKGDATGTTGTDCAQIDQIKEMTIEQDSLDVDRKVIQPKSPPGQRFEKSMSVLEKKSN